MQDDAVAKIGNDLWEKTERILQGTANPSSVMSLVYATKFGKSYYALADRAVSLQAELIKAGDIGTLLSLKRDVIRLEADFYRRSRKLSILSPIVFTYIGLAITFLVLSRFDLAASVTALVKNTLGVEPPVRLIAIGVVGAFLYLITWLLNEVEAREGTTGRITDYISRVFSLRLVLTLLVPIVLVVLVFRPDGSISPMKLSPEIVSFACGYSSKLVIDILNKLVEKASKMISAI